MLEIRGRQEPHYQEDGHHGGTYGSLQEGQRPYVTQQAAMVRRMVRLFLGGQCEGLAQQRQAHQQENQQGSPGELTVASRLGSPAAAKQAYADTIVARSYAARLSEMLWPSVGRQIRQHGSNPDEAT
jgi:hypothetical protein